MKPEGEITAYCRSIGSSDTVRTTGLHKINAFDLPLEERCARVSRIGKRALGVRVAAVSVFSGDKQQFRSAVGWRIHELPLVHSLCLPVRDNGKPLIVSDLRNDPRYRSARLVTGGPKFRFYAGYPLTGPEGHVIGTFCALDVTPRKPDAAFITTLNDLGQLAERELMTADIWDAQNQLVAKLGEARRQALLDTLTGVWNRRGGMELLNMMLERAATTFERFSVCIVDVDFFKDINDKLGHTTGDRVLTKVAETIASSVRPDDIVVRYGGDEFMIILRGSDVETSQSIAQRIRGNLKRAGLPKVKGGRGPTLSFGIAINDPAENLEARQLIERADEALYRTKHSGRDGVTLWSGGPHTAVR